MDTTCENCGRMIGRLEVPHVHQDHVVCGACHAVLAGASTMPAAPAEPYRALGLESRGMCFMIALVGLLLSPALVGVPILIWAMIADRRLYNHRKALMPKPAAKLPPPTNAARW